MSVFQLAEDPRQIKKLIMLVWSCGMHQRCSSTSGVQLGAVRNVPILCEDVETPWSAQQGPVARRPALPRETGEGVLQSRA